MNWLQPVPSSRRKKDESEGSEEEESTKKKQIGKVIVGIDCWY